MRPPEPSYTFDEGCELLAKHARQRLEHADDPNLKDLHVATGYYAQIFYDMGMDVPGGILKY